jgi:RHS repeat-associated protein
VPHLGQYYNRARYLDVERGRFWSQDTVEVSNLSAQWLNKYLYASANPVSYSDPSGHFSSAIATAAAVGIGLYIQSKLVSAIVSKGSGIVAGAILGVGVDFAYHGSEVLALAYLVQEGEDWDTNDWDQLTTAIFASLFLEYEQGVQASINAMSEVGAVVGGAQAGVHLVAASVKLAAGGIKLAYTAGKQLATSGNLSARVDYSPVSPSTPGAFSVWDWSGYPHGVPKPNGPFVLIEGAAYESARAAANNANKALRRKLSRDGVPVKGKEIHELHPVVFGGDPTNPGNKVILSKSDHVEFTSWWKSIQRRLTEGD